MLHYLRFSYFLFIVILSLLLFKNQYDLANYCRILISITLLIYLWEFKEDVSPKIFLWLNTLIFFSVLPFVFFNPYKFDPNNIFKVFFLIVHLCYIQIFKLEGANIFLNKKLFFAFLILIGVGLIGLEVVNHHLSNLIFIVYILLTFQKIILIWLAFNRVVNKKSYEYGIWAMICFIISDIFYVVNIFITSENLLMISNLKINFFYLIGQFLLFESIIIQHHHQKQSL